MCEKNKILKRITALILLKLLFVTFINATSIVFKTDSNEPLIITATRIEENIKDVPNTVVIITDEDIADMHALTLKDVLNNVSGVDIKSYGGLGSISSISINGSKPSEVLVLLDSVPLNSVSSGEANLSQVPLNIIKRIEILKGGNSNIHGENASFGTVNIITKEPDYLEKNISLQYGSFDSFDADFHCSDKISNFGYLITGKYSKSNGYRESNDDYFGKNIFTKINYITNNDLKINIDFNYSDMETGTPGPFPEVGTIPFGGNEFVYELNSRNKFKKLVYNTNIIVPMEVSNFYIQAFYTQEELFNVYNDKVSFSKFNTDITGGSFKYDCEFLENNKTILGVDFKNNKFKSLSEPFTSFWNAQTDNFAFWMQNKFDLDSFIINYGLRFDNNSGFKSVYSPNLGLVYRIDEDTRFYGNISKAYKAPSFNQLYWPLFWGYQGNVNLEPEYTTSFMLGYEFSVLDVLFSNVSLYKKNTKDKIAPMFDPMTFVSMPENLNRNEMFGCDLSLLLKIIEEEDLSFDYNITYTFTDSFDVNSLDVKSVATYIPKNKIHTSLDFKSYDNFSASFKARYRSKITNGYKDLNEVWVCDLFLNKVLSDTLELFFVVENVFDENYSEQFGYSLKDRDYPMPPLSVRVGTSIRF